MNKNNKEFLKQTQRRIECEEALNGSNTFVSMEIFIYFYHLIINMELSRIFDKQQEFRDLISKYVRESRPEQTDEKEFQLLVNKLGVEYYLIGIDLIGVLMQL